MPDCMRPAASRKLASTDAIHSKKNQMAGEIEAQKKAEAEKAKREIPQAPSSMFFMANEALGPPYRVLIDTNFLSHTVRSKLDLQKALMDLVRLLYSL